MKIRIESEYFVPTFQSIFNWNDIKITTKSASKSEHNFFEYNDKRKKLRCSLRQNMFDDVYSILALRNNCYCHHNDAERIRKEANGSSKRRVFSSILPKLTQLCFVLILLLPFLFTCTTLIQEASGENIKAIPTILSSPKKLWLSSTYTKYMQQRPKANKSCQNKWNFKLKFNNFTNNKQINVMKSHSIIKGMRRTYSSNHSLNEHSLIILSQHDSKINQTTKINTAAQTILHGPKSIFNFVSDSGPKTKRSKRSLRKSGSQNDEAEKHKNYYQINNRINKQKLTELVMNGLGLKKLPDMKKANISQLEYSSKYLQYLERVRKNQGVGNGNDGNIYYAGGYPPTTTLRILTIVTNSFSDITANQSRRQRERRAPREPKRGIRESSKSFRDKTNILLHFPLAIDDADAFHYKKLDEANVRLMMLYNPALAAQSHHHRSKKEQGLKKNKISMNRKGNCNSDDTISTDHQQNRRPKIHSHILKLSVYQLLPMNKRKQLDARKIEFEKPMNDDETHSQWLEFDVTEAVRGWLNKSCENLGIEIQCDKCRRIGARILNDVFSSHHLDEDDDRFHLSPVLNIIGHIGHTHREKGMHSYNHSNYSHHRNPKKTKMWPNSCYKPHQRCCRHQLNVAFKDIKGFEFIIQPKIFDAGYCLGRCPPRHNPAHHHALLQSLIWQQDHNRVPRPCCTPSKLTELEILHVDEEHSDKLKISTWSNMQVSECACS